MVSSVGSVLLPLKVGLRIVDSSGSSESFVPNNAKLPNLVSFEKKRIVCGCMAPPRNIRPADANGFSPTKFNVKF